MAASSPVVAIRTTSNENVIGDNDGLYFSNETDLASSIEKLESFDDETHAAMKTRNRLAIATCYGWEKCVDAHIGAFSKFDHRIGGAGNAGQ
jgi:hypothetical protein